MPRLRDKALRSKVPFCHQVAQVSLVVFPYTSYSPLINRLNLAPLYVNAVRLCAYSIQDVGR